MGIDWEGLLDAEGDELQDAYDEAVSAWNRCDQEEEEWLEDVRAWRRLSLYRSEDPEDRRAVRKALERCFHTEFHWTIFGTPRPGLKAYLWEGDAKRIVMTDAGNRIILLSEPDSRRFEGYNGEDGKECYFDWDYFMNGLMQKRDPFQNRNVSGLKHEYDADGMPLRVYGKYCEVYDDYEYYERIEFDDYTVWRRQDFREEVLTWVFERVQDEGGLVLRPLEIWQSRGWPELIWRKRI